MLFGNNFKDSKDKELEVLLKDDFAVLLAKLE